MTPAPTDVVLVVDTGVDDALALLLALRSPSVNVRGIACVAGNVEVDQVVANTLRVLDAADAPDVPLGRGTTPGPGGRSVHGVDGLGDLHLPASPRRPVLRSINAVLDRPEPYVLLALAPCTDVVEALSTQIDSVMALAGFNRTHDPAAFAAVVESRPAVVYEQPVWQGARVTRRDAERLAVTADPATSLAGRLLLHQVRRGGGESGSIGDAVIVAALLAGDTANPDGLACASIFVEAFGERQ
jgi:pyrimidine-specific ribonucleoside hydrolase